jgi:hypothetical protein
MKEGGDGRGVWIVIAADPKGFLKPLGSPERLVKKGEIPMFGDGKRFPRSKGLHVGLVVVLLFLALAPMGNAAPQ